MKYLYYKLLILAFLFFTVTVKAGEVLWTLDVESHEPGAVPEFGEGLEILEEDGQKILSKVDGGTQFFPRSTLSKQEIENWNDIVFRVRFREAERSGTALVVKRYGLRKDVGYQWYYVHVGREEIRITCHGLSEDAGINVEDPRVKSAVKYSEMGESPLAFGEWVTAEVQVGDEVLKVAVDDGDGGNRKAEFKILPGTGGVSILSNVPVDIASASVLQADAPVTASE